MRRLILMLASFLLANLVQQAQTIENGVSDKHYIEVSGTSETEVTPDEIYITITLLERNEGKEKVGIEKQEADLKQIVKGLGIDASNLVLAKADADYRKSRNFKKDLMISKSYILKINNAELLAKLYEQLDKINAEDAYVSRFTHSKILDLQKENRIKALKSAKEKVEYLLAAIGQQAGPAIQVTESANFVDDGSFPMPRAAYMNARQSLSEADAGNDAEQISFKKIKIRSSFLVKYEIKNR